MKESIFEGFGCKIHKIDQQYFISFDEGEMVIAEKTYEISEEEASDAQKTEYEAYRICLKAQLRSTGYWK